MRHAPVCEQAHEAVAVHIAQQRVARAAVPASMSGGGGGGGVHASGRVGQGQLAERRRCRKLLVVLSCSAGSQRLRHQTAAVRRQTTHQRRGRPSAACAAAEAALKLLAPRCCSPLPRLMSPPCELGPLAPGTALQTAERVLGGLRAAGLLTAKLVASMALAE